MVITCQSQNSQYKRLLTRPPCHNRSKDLLLLSSYNKIFGRLPPDGNHHNCHCKIQTASMTGAAAGKFNVSAKVFVTRKFENICKHRMFFTAAGQPSGFERYLGETCWDSWGQALEAMPLPPTVGVQACTQHAHGFTRKLVLPLKLLQDCLHLHAMPSCKGVLPLMLRWWYHTLPYR